MENYTKVNWELIDIAIKHLQSKGFEVRVDGDKESEQIKAVTNQGLRFHMDTIFLSGLDKEKVSDYVDKQLKLLNFMSNGK